MIHFAVTGYSVFFNKNNPLKFDVTHQNFCIQALYQIPKAKNGKLLHSRYAVILQKYHDPHLYLHWPDTGYSFLNLCDTISPKTAVDTTVFLKLGLQVCCK